MCYWHYRIKHHATINRRSIEQRITDTAKGKPATTTIIATKLASKTPKETTIVAEYEIQRHVYKARS